MRIFFSRFYYSKKTIDLSKPTIVISNHNNAFIDPIIFPATIFQKTYFIVRGDIFNTPLKRWLLWNLGQIPMFRIRDGIQNVKLNTKSFEKCNELLGKNKNIIIFPEADCVQKKRLRSVKKGTARMAFGAIEKHGWDMDLQLLPFLNNYTYPREFRTEIISNMLEAIEMKKYRTQYEKNPNSAINQLTKDITSAMEEGYINIKQPENDQLFEQLVIPIRNNNSASAFPWKRDDSQRFKTEKRLANGINKLEIESPKRVSLIKDTRNYLAELKAHNITDKALIGKTPNYWLGWLVICLGFPAYVLGILLNIFQFSFATHVADKKIKQVIFQNSIRFGVLLFINLFLGTVLTAILYCYIDTLALLTPFSLIALALFTINYHEYISDWLSTIGIKKVSKETMDNLLNQRKKIMDLVNDL